MAIDNVPVTLGFHTDKVVGRISLEPEIEGLLVGGHKLGLSLSLVIEESGGWTVKEVALIPIPAREEADHVRTVVERHPGVPKLPGE